MGNYAFSDPRGGQFAIVTIIFLSISVLSTILRIVSRRMRKLSIEWDDGFIIFGTMVVFGGSVSAVFAVTSGGFGHHNKDLTFAESNFVAKELFVFEIIYGVSLTAIKTSMCLFLYKLFGTKRSMRICIYVTLAWVWAWGIAMILTCFLICHPIEYGWNPNIEGTCGDRNAFFMATGSLNIFNDVCLIVIPIPYIWNLQLPSGRRLGLIATFAIGSLTGVISIVRVTSLTKIDYSDVSYTLPIPQLWTFLEIQLALIAANIPLLRPVASAILPSSWMGSSNHDESTHKRSWFTGRGTLATTRTNANSSRKDTIENKSGIRTFMRSHKKKKDASVNMWTNWTNNEDGDGRSDVELATNAMDPSGIQVKTDFKIEEEENDHSSSSSY